VLVVVLVAVSVPHLTLQHLEPMHESSWAVWKQFVGTILALSGVEAIANMTGILKLDPGSTPEHPKVGRESSKAIWAVSIEVVFGTALLAWAMLSIPRSMLPQLQEHKADMLRLIAEYFGSLTVNPAFGQALGWATGILFFLLLISAANTAMVAMIGVFYMMARDGEMPTQFTKLNRFGVPWLPLVIAIVLPSIVLILSPDFDALAGLYAIGVVGAIALNLGSCTFNRGLDLHPWERILFGFTFAVLSMVELTLAHEKHDALFFVVIILSSGLGLRAYAQKRQGLTSVTLTNEVAALVKPETLELLRPRLVDGQRILVAARGVTPVLRFAMDEAFLRKAQLLVLYVQEVAVFMPSAGPQKKARWQDNAHAAAIMTLVLKLGAETGVDVLPVYAVSTDPGSTIIDLAATLGVDYLMLGAAHRFSLAKLLKGSVVEHVAAGLPEDIQLIIHG
jgi:amino acid transporter